MNWTKDEVIRKLQSLLDICMESCNQEGSLKITEVEFNDDTCEDGNGKISFTFCTPEPENPQPYFVEY
jgi:hypothetical protein